MQWSKLQRTALFLIGFTFFRVSRDTPMCFPVGKLALTFKKNSNPAFIVTFGDCSEISPNFISKFLSNVTNNTNLSKYLANKFLASHEGKQSVLHVAFGDSIISNSEAVLSETDINQCNSEETNPGIVRHVINLEQKGYTNVQVKLVDSDIFFCFLRMLKLLY